MKVILISGKSHSGKDQFAAYLRTIMERNQKRILTIHFGDAVKMFAKIAYNWDGVKDEHGRNLLQTMGTNKVKANDPRYWAELVARFIAATSEDWDYVLIPDARFPDEIQTVSSFFPCNNVVTIRMMRVPVVNETIIGEQANHISETALDDNYNFDYYISNQKSTLEELFDKAQTIFDVINKK